MANSPYLIVLKNSIPNQMTPHQECGYRVIWTLHPGGWFSVSSAWRAFNAHRPPVPWHPLVWFGDSLPRASFILWLAIRGRLGTHDRLFNLSPDACCLLCGNFQEDHNHFFFGCALSMQIWREIQEKVGMVIPLLGWDSLIQWIFTA